MVTGSQTDVLRALVDQTPSLPMIFPFGTVGYLRRHNPPHKLVSHGNKCIPPGTTMDRSSLTYRVQTHHQISGSVPFRCLAPVEAICIRQADRRKARGGGSGGYKHAPLRRSFTSTILETIIEYLPEIETELGPGISKEEGGERPNTTTTTPTTALQANWQPTTSEKMQPSDRDPHVGRKACYDLGALFSKVF